MQAAYTAPCQQHEQEYHNAYRFDLLRAWCRLTSWQAPPAMQTAGAVSCAAVSGAGHFICLNQAEGCHTATCHDEQQGCENTASYAALSSVIRKVHMLAHTF
jgi:hypothetical protein